MYNNTSRLLVTGSRGNLTPLETTDLCFLANLFSIKSGCNRLKEWYMAYIVLSVIWGQDGAEKIKQNL